MDIKFLNFTSEQKKRPRKTHSMPKFWQQNAYMKSCQPNEKMKVSGSSFLHYLDFGYELEISKAVH